MQTSKNNSCSGVVAAVERGLADFSFNLLLTGQREEAIDFTVPYQGTIQFLVWIWVTLSDQMPLSPFVCPSLYQHLSGRASSDLFQALVSGLLFLLPSLSWVG